MRVALKPPPVGLVPGEEAGPTVAKGAGEERGFRLQRCP